MKVLFFSIIFFISFINSYNCNEIPNGLYIIKNKANLNLCLINSSLYFSSEESCQFYIYKKDNQPLHEYDLAPSDENTYYFIEEEKTGKKLFFNESNNTISLSNQINTKDFSVFLWEIHPKKDSFFEIKSKIKKFFISYEETKEKTTKAFCESSWSALAGDRDTKIKFIEIYHELEKKSDKKILEKELIDVVIKYIDVKDENINRKHLGQIEKDKHNNELKYSLRSIFKNIPWINKIFIIMPNDKIDFLKDKEEIENKIIFIKDSAILGFESSSPPAFQFNLHKLKKYNLSENFILMDDDYFIAQPLKKSDLFYEEKGKVYPLLISDEYYNINFDKLENELLNCMDKIDEINYHSKEGFEFRKASTLSFVYKIFDDNYDTNNLIGVGYTHNAIPLKLSDVEEVFDKIESDYKYSEFCLRGNKRNLRNLIPQIMFMSYARNKYNRPVNKISWKYYDLSEINNVNLNTQLLVINKEDKVYDNNIYKKEEEVLNKLFPDAIKYEKNYVESSDKPEEEKNNKANFIDDYIEQNKDDINEKNKKNIQDEQELFNMNDNKNDNDKGEKNENNNKNNEENINNNNDINNEEEKNDENKNEEINNKQEKEKEKEEEKEKEKEKEIEKKKEKKDDKKISTNEKQVNESKEITKKNQNQNDVNYDKKFRNIEIEINNQKNEYKDKYEKLLEEIKKLKLDLKSNSNSDSTLITKLQTLTETQNELNKKISSLEKENLDLKKAQNDFSEKISNTNQENNLKDEANKAIKQVFTDIQDQSLKMQKKINDLSEEKNALIEKINSMQTNMDEKDDKINKLKEENDNLKLQLKELESNVNTISNHINNLNALENSYNQNEERINLLNNEITQLKKKLNDESTKKDNDIKINNDAPKPKKLVDYDTTYIIIFSFVCIAAIYCIYRIYFGKEGGDSRKLRHMNISSHAGYGSISSTNFM